jgi:hypothetical protein
MDGNAPDRDLLISFYNNVYDGVRNYKHMQWQVVVLTLGLFAGIIGLSQSDTLLMSQRPPLQWAFSAFVAAAAIASSWFIHETARQLRKQRQHRRRIEEMCGFFDEGVFTKGAILDPSDKGKPVSYWQDRNYLLSWWIVIWTCAAYTTLVIWA